MLHLLYAAVAKDRVSCSSATPLLAKFTELCYDIVNAGLNAAQQRLRL